MRSKRERKQKGTSARGAKRKRDDSGGADHLCTLEADDVGYTLDNGYTKLFIRYV